MRVIVVDSRIHSDHGMFIKGNFFNISLMFKVTCIKCCLELLTREFCCNQSSKNKLESHTPRTIALEYHKAKISLGKSSWHEIGCYGLKYTYVILCSYDAEDWQRCIVLSLIIAVTSLNNFIKVWKGCFCLKHCNITKPIRVNLSRYGLN